MLMETLPLIIAMSLFILGLIGTFVPVLPEASLIWLGMLIYGLLTGFENLSVLFYILQALAAILVMATDYLATAVGTKRFNGSKLSIVGASIGLLVGLLTLGPLGIIFGPFLGALMGEMIYGSSFQKAVRASIGSVIGILGGMFVKVIIQIIMIVWFFIKIL